jgi:hypothetical protein
MLVPGNFGLAFARLNAGVSLIEMYLLVNKFYGQATKGMR